MNDTIFARSTAPGKAGVAVVRVSGPKAFDVCKKLAGTCPPAGQHRLCELRDANGQLIDCALVLAFGDGRSFTGEDVVEFQLHGSPAIVAAVERLLGDQGGLRPADAGEFTRRALENDKLDLAQIEGLGDLLDAETESQRRAALRVFQGELGQLAEQWRDKLIHAQSLIEATIDFADEEVPVDVSPEVISILETLKLDFVREAAGVANAEKLREGFVVAIVGHPNSGKSTLLNYLAKRDVAITSEHAGTTRDVIELAFDLNGIPLTILDTAGIREAFEEIESLGIDRAIERASSADLRVFIKDNNGLPNFVQPDDEDIILVGKGDLHSDLPDAVSGVTGLGVATLLDRLETILSKRVASIGTATRQRHELAINEALIHVESSLEEIRLGSDRAELASEELRLAAAAIGGLTGRIDVEDLLDRIFSSFCIGK